MSRTFRTLAVFVAALATAIAAAATTAPASAATGNKYSGYATPIAVDVPGVLPAPIKLGDTDVFLTGSDEFHDRDSVVDAEIPASLTGGLVAVKASALHATTIAHGNHARSEARVADVDVTLGGYNVTAELINVETRARCTPSGAVVSADVDLVNLVVTGVTGEPIAINDDAFGLEGQTIDGGVLKIFLGSDQDLTAADSTTRSAVVIELYDLNGKKLASVTLAEAHSDITCAKPLSTCLLGSRFVTGGGQIVPAGVATMLRVDELGEPITFAVNPLVDERGTKATFAVAGRELSSWGHLVYLEHDLRFKAHGQPTITVFVDDITAVIEGTFGKNSFVFKRNGRAFEITEFVVNVVDMGEPGRDDKFTIALLGFELDPVTGLRKDPLQTTPDVVYAAARSSAPNVLRGNIQFHNRCK